MDVSQKRQDFYFDDQEELEEFKNQLKELFTNYCGEISFIETYEDYQKQIDAEDFEYFAEFPIRYLIRDKDHSYDLFKQADFSASYSNEVGTAIHTELPKWIPEEGQVIKSTDPMYKEILLKAAERLENEIKNNEYQLKNAKINLHIINKELNIGLKAKE